MSISYPIAFPGTPGAQNISIRKRSAVAVEASPFSYVAQSYVWPGMSWGAQIQLPPMQRASAEPWVAALSSLNGMEGSFLLGDTANRTPRGSANAQAVSPRVRGASQTGRVLNTQGWSPSASLPVLCAGDWLQLGGRNLLQRSQEFDNAVWNKSLLTVTANTHTAPWGGGVTADKLTAAGADGSIDQAFTPAGQWPHVFSVWIKSPSVSGFIDIAITVVNSAGVAVYQATVRVTTQYSRKSGVFTPIDTGSHRVFIGGASTFATGAADLVVWGAMVDPVPYLREYQPTTSAAYLVSENLYKVMADAYADASGYSSLELWPALRSSPADNAPLTYNYPLGKFMLAQDADWSINESKVYGLGFSAVEDLRP